MEKLFLLYAQLQEKLRQWYSDSSECDEEYVKNFPTEGSHSEKIRYNEKYRKDCEKLAERGRDLNEQLDRVEEEIHALFPEFLPRKSATKRE